MMPQPIGSTPQRKPRKLATPQKPITIHDVARDCYQAARGDVKRAAKIMQRQVSNNRELLSQLSEEFIRFTCVEATGQIMRSERLKTWLPPNYDKGGNGHRITDLVTGNRAMMMDFPLPSGKRIGDAVASEVRDAAAFYGKQAKDMGHKARWLSLVADCVAKNKTVRESLTEKKLRELQQESING
jgi:hypothetical protein